MQSSNKVLYRVVNIIIILIGILMALFLLLFGVANLINPDVPDNYLNQNTRICVMFILSSLVISYAIFRPFSGGIVVCICALIFFVIVINNPVSIPIILFGILSIVRGYLNRQKVLKGTDRTE